MIGTIFNKIQHLMDNSVFFRCIEWIMAFIARLFSGSVVVKGLGTEINKDRLESSMIYRIINFIPSLLYKLRRAFAENLWNGSFIVSYVKTLPIKLASLNIRHIGIGGLAGSAAYYLLSGGLNGFFCAVVIGSALCIISTAKVYNLMKTSLFVRFLEYVFDFSLPELTLNKKSNVLYPLLYGVFCGAALGFLPLKYGVVAVCIIPAALIVVAYPFMGVLAVVFVAPFIPTMLVAALIAGVFVLLIIKLLTDETYSFSIDLTGVFVFSYIIITLFKGFTSFTPQTSINIALITSLFMMSYFLVTSLVNSTRKFQWLIFTFSFSAMLTGLYGFWQKFSGKMDTTHLDKELFEGIKLRVFSTFGNPNVYGEYLLLAIPLAIIGIYLAKSLLLKLYYGGVSALLLVNLALTYSRGCYLAIALGVFVFILLMEKRLIALFSVGIFILPMLLPASMIERLLSITNLADSSTAYRISIYQGSLRIIQRFWLLGLGQGMEAFNTAYPLYGFSGVTAPHSHNLFLQVFVETGIFGFTAFMAMLYCFFKSIFPVFFRTKSTEVKWVTAGLAALMTSFMLQSIFDYSLYNYKVYMLFFVVLALPAAYAGALRKEGKNA